MADRALPILGPRFKGWKDDATVNSGGKVYFYAAGTTTLKDTYQDAERTTANANPVVLDSRGEASIYGAGAYKIIEQDSDGNQLGDAQDGVLLLDVSDNALALLNDQTYSDMRTTLGLGTAAIKDAGTSADNVLLLAENDTLPALDGSNLTNIAAGAAAMPFGYLSGFTLSRNANTTLGITAGASRDSTNAANMSQSSAFTKTLASWVAGTGNGSLDAGSLSTSTYYHVFAINNATTSTSDFLVSLSATSPTMPSGYAYFRRVGSFKTDANPFITDFSQFGDLFLWLDPPLDIEVTGVGTAAVNRTISVPTNVQVQALLNITFGNPDGASSLYISSPDVNDEVAVSSGAGPLATIVANTTGTRWAGGIIKTRTSTSAQVRSRVSLANSSIDISCLGWEDDLGRNG